MQVMSDISEQLREQNRKATGEFGEHPRSAPEVGLAGKEQLVWLIEGDDHEARVYEAASASEAEDLAIAEFADQYEEDDGDYPVDVVAAFRGSLDDDDPADWVWVSGVGSAATEARARAVLNHVEF